MHIPTRSASRFAAKILSLGLLSALALPSFAAPKMDSKMAPKMDKMSSSTTSKKSTQVTGTVLSKTGNSLTIKPTMKSKGATKTISVPSTASVTMGGAKCSLAMIKPGEKVTVRMNGAGKVTSVMCMPMKSSTMGGSKMGGKMSGSKMSGSKMGGKM